MKTTKTILLFAATAAITAHSEWAQTASPDIARRLIDLKTSRQNQEGK